MLSQPTWQQYVRLGVHPDVDQHDDPGTYHEQLAPHHCPDYSTSISKQHSKSKSTASTQSTL